MHKNHSELRGPFSRLYTFRGFVLKRSRATFSFGNLVRSRSLLYVYWQTNVMLPLKSRGRQIKRFKFAPYTRRSRKTNATWLYSKRATAPSISSLPQTSLREESISLASSSLFIVVSRKILNPTFTDPGAPEDLDATPEAVLWFYTRPRTAAKSARSLKPRRTCEWNA